MNYVIKNKLAKEDKDKRVDFGESYKKRVPGVYSQQVVDVVAWLGIWRQSER